MIIETSIPMTSVEIVNIAGQTVYEQILKHNSVKINTSKFVAGTYIAVIHTENGMVQQQFVVK